MVADDPPQSLDGVKDLVLIDTGIGLGVFPRHLQELGVGREYLRHVLDPRHVFLDRGVRNLKRLLLRVEGDGDSDRLVVLVQHFLAQQSCSECGDALLAIDEDSLAS